LTAQDLQTVSRTLFNAVTGLKVRPRFCRAEGPSGLHRSPQRGETVEFSEYRPYAPGAELRFLDWKLYARCDRLFVKSFCDERASRFLIVLDDSPSMVYPLEGFTKLNLACELAMGIAYLAAHRQKDAVRLLPLSSVPAGPNEQHQALGHMMLELQKISSSARISAAARVPSGIADSLSKLEFRRPTTVIFISDLYEHPAELQKLSLRARRQGHEYWFLHVLSKEEIALPYESLHNFIDVESNQRMQLDPRAIRAHYSRAVHDHISALRTLAAHGRFVLGIVGQDPAEILKRLLQD